MQKTFYLDTNAWSYLFERKGVDEVSAESFRERLYRRKADREMRFLGSLEVIEELARMALKEPARYRTRIQFYFQCVGPFLLKPVNVRVREEVSQRADLPGDRAFMSYRDVLTARSLAVADRATDIADVVYALVTERRNLMRGLRKRAIAKLRDAELAVTVETRRWWGGADNVVRDWLREYLRTSKDLLALPDDERLWPDPFELKTPRRVYQYALGRIAMNLGEGRKISDGDSYDWYHFANAGYADVFVTDDAAMRETIAAIPARLDDPDVVGFEEFRRLVQDSWSMTAT